MRVPAPLKSIAEQAIRAAASVPANLAEGAGRCPLILPPTTVPETRPAIPFRPKIRNPESEIRNRGVPTSRILG